MGTITTAAIISAASAAAQAGLAADRAAKTARAQFKANRAAFEAQVRQQKLAQDTSERQRKENLRREKAKRRARLGAQAGGTSSGSGAAILRGLATGSARQGRDQARQRNLLLQDSLSTLNNRNRNALLHAKQARQAALFNLGTGIARFADNSLSNALRKQRKSRSTSVNPNPDLGTLA